MTIRKQLALIFGVILILSVANLVVDTWSDAKRNASLESLRRATERQVLLVQMGRQLNDLYKQNELLGQLVTSTDTEPLPAAQIEAFDERVDQLRDQLADLRELSEAGALDTLIQLEDTFDQLARSWRRFNLNFGRDHETALTELIATAEPLSQVVINTQLPALELEEEARMVEAGDGFYEVQRLTDRLSLGIFLASSGILLTLVVLFSRALTHRLTLLRQGAERLGEGELDHQIEETSRDELGTLAFAFNNMALKLQAAHRRLTESSEAMEAQYHAATEQRERAQELLLNILPPATAEELTSEGEVSPRYYEDATVMFGDISGFTLSSEKMAADELVAVLHQYFTAFDQVVVKYGLEKLKTIGDCYMCVGGVPERKPSHAVDMVLACMELRQVVENLHDQGLGPEWKLRIGLHTGPVIAGVVGIKKFAFDIWGNTVNLASRMESSGEAGEINVSEQTLIHIKDFFDLEERGAVMTKDRRYVPMYFVRRVKPTLLEGEGPIPEAFARRYEVYFERRPEAFPAFLLTTPDNEDSHQAES